MVEEFSKNIDMQDIGLFWQLTIKTIDDLKIIGNENLTLEMYVMQLVHLKSVNDEKNLDHEVNISNKNNEGYSTRQQKDEINSEDDSQNQIKNQLKSTNQIKTNPIKSSFKESEKTKIEITSLKDLIEQTSREKEIELKYDLERNVKLVSFNKGVINLSFNDKLNKNFIKNLTEKLFKWTGKRWVITFTKNNEAKSIYERNLESEQSRNEKFKRSKVGQEIEAAFPDAKLIEIKEEE
tara:strand:+ start:613 stop:1323 length:711 start_codon:yes stop_codon:yes gene_type:complete